MAEAEAGGGLLPPPPGPPTSGDAEYAGLCLGLRWAAEEAGRGGGGVLGDAWRGEMMAAVAEEEEAAAAGGGGGGGGGNPAASASASVSASAPLASLTVRGDCRTVIDQLGGRSRPRKLRARYEEARGWLDQLVGYAGGALGASEVRIGYEWVGREDNLLCDAASGMALGAGTAREVDRARRAIQAAEAEAEAVARQTPGGSPRLPASRKRRFRLRDTPYAEAIGSIVASRRIPPRHRIDLCRRVAAAAVRGRDGAALRRLGEALAGERRPSPDLAAAAACMELQGLRMLGLDKEAGRAERRLRLRGSVGDRRIEDVLSDFSGSGGGSGGAGLGDLDGPDFGQDEWTSLLREWHALATDRRAPQAPDLDRGIWLVKGARSS